MREKHPDWALAYILQDWKQRGRATVARAYDLASSESSDPLDLMDAVREARRKLAVYVTALDEIIKEWDDDPANEE